MTEKLREHYFYVCSVIPFGVAEVRVGRLQQAHERHSVLHARDGLRPERAFPFLAPPDFPGTPMHALFLDLLSVILRG